MSNVSNLKLSHVFTIWYHGRPTIGNETKLNLSSRDFPHSRVCQPLLLYPLSSLSERKTRGTWRRTGSSSLSFLRRSQPIREIGTKDRAEKAAVRACRHRFAPYTSDTEASRALLCGWLPCSEAKGRIASPCVRRRTYFLGWKEKPRDKHLSFFPSCQR